jgi:hypothetical protein
VGTVITFPAERSARTGNPPEYRAEHATVVILPVVRIERHDDSSGGIEPNPRSTSGGKRRKR